MKKRIFKIAIIMIMFSLVYATIASALSFTATMTPSSTTVAESTEFTVKIKVSNLDVGPNGINILSGYLKYDKDVFELITDSSIDGLNGWNPAYTADSEKTTITKPTFVKSEEEVFQVTLKTKSGVSGKTGKVEFTNIVASNTESEIQAPNISTEITVGTVSENTTNNAAMNNPVVIQPSNVVKNTNTSTNTNTNRNVARNTNVNNTINAVNNTQVKAVNNATPDEITHAGVEDTIVYIMGAVIILAIVFYIKFERVNKEIR